jgi:hypothetical protein
LTTDQVIENLNQTMAYSVQEVEPVLKALHQSLTDPNTNGNSRIVTPDQPSRPKGVPIGPILDALMTGVLSLLVSNRQALAVLTEWLRHIDRQEDNESGKVGDERGSQSPDFKQDRTHKSTCRMVATTGYHTEDECDCGAYPGSGSQGSKQSRMA